MCEPTTVAIAGVALAGGVMKGIAAKQAGDTNAAIDIRNAVIAQQAAGDARLRGDIAAERSKEKYGVVEGQQKTAYASANVDVTKGSPVDVLSNTEMMSELDRKVIQNNAQREAWGYENQSQQFMEKSRLDEQMGNFGLVGGMLDGVTGGAMIYASQLRVS